MKYVPCHLFVSYIPPTSCGSIYRRNISVIETKGRIKRRSPSPRRTSGTSSLLYNSPVAHVFVLNGNYAVPIPKSETYVDAEIDFYGSEKVEEGTFDFDFAGLISSEVDQYAMPRVEWRLL